MSSHLSAFTHTFLPACPDFLSLHDSCRFDMIVYHVSIYFQKEEEGIS